MKKNIYIILLVIVAASCNTLDLKPLDKLSEADAWTDKSLIRLYVNATYSSTFLHGVQTDLLSSATDEAYCIHNYGNTRVVQTGALTPDNVSGLTAKLNYFNFAYGNIRNINIFFSKIDAAPVEDEFKTGVRGEMKFMRAYLFANLIWRYGDVPLITKVFALNEDYSVSRTAYDECVKFIVQELDEAITLLPEDQPAGQLGLASANACKALKSRVLLYSASVLNNPSHNQIKWQNAADAAAALLKSGYSLNNDYQKTFLEQNKEIIFARYFTQSNSTDFHTVEGRNGSDGWGAHNPTQNIVNAYEMKANGELPYFEQADGSLTLNPASGYDPSRPYEGRDPRFDASILHDGSVWANRETETFHGGKDSPEGAGGWNASLTAYLMKKFIVEDLPPSGSTLKQTNPWIFFRYAEILLNYAEAKFELGDQETAREYVNLVRARPGVNMPPVTDMGEDLRKRIQNERRVELAFEEHRFFDVRRWKIADVTENKDLLGVSIQKTTPGKTYNIIKVLDRKFESSNYLMPIPRAEIDKSKGSLMQSQGY